MEEIKCGQFNPKLYKIRQNSEEFSVRLLRGPTGLIKHNPFDNFDQYQETERTRYLTETELSNLLEQAAKSRNPDLRDIIIAGILTGLRKQNILKLHESELDFDMETITVTVKGSEQLTIAFPAPLISSFEQRITENKSGHVFVNRKTGNPYGDVKKAFRKALKDAGITDFRFHDLRHTFATYALLNSKDLRAVQETLGHQRVSTTQKYAHVLTRQKRNVIDQTSSFFMPFMVKKTDKKINQDKNYTI